MKRSEWYSHELRRQLRTWLSAKCPSCGKSLGVGIARCRQCNEIRPELKSHGWIVSASTGLCTVTGFETDTLIPGGHYVWLPLFLHSYALNWLDDHYYPTAACPFIDLLIPNPIGTSRKSRKVSPDEIQTRFELTKARLERLASQASGPEAAAVLIGIRSKLAMVAIKKAGWTTSLPDVRDCEKHEVIRRGMDWIRTWSEVEDGLAEVERLLRGVDFAGDQPVVPKVDDQ